MCGRYYVDDKVEKEVEKLVGKIEENLKEEQKKGDIYPNDKTIILVGEKEKLCAKQQRWGFPGFGKKNQVIFNARSETAAEKRIFRKSLQACRCIIPATWFYEWDKEKNKVAFYRKDTSILYLAGFYNQFEDGERFVILTTEANASVKKVHDRMPLILEEKDLLDFIYKEEKTEEFLKRRPLLLENRIEFQ